jgi:hypothetical protein
MQPPHPFQEWLWGNHPWMVPILYLSMAAVGATVFLLLCWVRTRTHEPLHRPLWFGLLVGAGFLGGAACAWLFQGADGLNGLFVGPMLCLGFFGLIVGLFAGLIVQAPKRAAYGAGGGLVLCCLFAVLEFWLRVSLGHDPWSAEAWEARAVFALLHAGLGAVLAVTIATMRPARL